MSNSPLPYFVPIVERSGPTQRPRPCTRWQVPQAFDASRKKTAAPRPASPSRRISSNDRRQRPPAGRTRQRQQLVGPVADPAVGQGVEDGRGLGLEVVGKLLVAGQVEKLGSAVLKPRDAPQRLATQPQRVHGVGDHRQELLACVVELGEGPDGGLGPGRRAGLAVNLGDHVVEHAVRSRAERAEGLDGGHDDVLRLVLRQGERFQLVPVAGVAGRGGEGDPLEPLIRGFQGLRDHPRHRRAILGGAPGAGEPVGEHREQAAAADRVVGPFGDDRRDVGGGRDCSTAATRRRRPAEVPALAGSARSVRAPAATRADGLATAGRGTCSGRSSADPARRPR